MSDAPVPIFSDPDWREHPGAELASVGSQPEEDVNEVMLGLVYDGKQRKWVSPRVDALQRQTIRVEDLDDEELLRGQVRDADGRFRGGQARKIPREFHNELMRRIIEQGVSKMKRSYVKAVEVLTEDIIEDESVDIRLRYDAAKYIIERLGGKTPEVVNATVEVKRWEQVMDTIIKEVPVEIIEGEVEDDEDD